MTIKDEVLKRYFKKFAQYPDLDNPRDFNEKIQWLKIFDQEQWQITNVVTLRVAGMEDASL